MASTSQEGLEPAVSHYQTHSLVAPNAAEEKIVPAPIRPTEAEGRKEPSIGDLSTRKFCLAIGIIALVVIGASVGGPVGGSKVTRD